MGSKPINPRSFRTGIGSRWPSLGSGRNLLLLLALLLLTPLWASGGQPANDSVAAQIGAVAGHRLFSIAAWEIEVLSRQAQRIIFGGSAADAADSESVRAYFALGEKLADVRRRELRLRVDQPPGWQETATLLRAEAQAVREERQALAPVAESVLRRQMDQAIQELGLRRGFVDVEPQAGWPPLQVEITPAVFFTFTQLPAALAVGPRDQIAITYSTLLTPGLDAAARESLESSLDQSLDVASVVIDIGGFAAYPSMIPANSSLDESLDIIAHEWVHHYLAPRPLGWNYFQSYELRSINETVADLAGREIAAHVRERHYPELRQTQATEAMPDTSRAAGGESFGDAMRRIRRETEELLRTGNLELVEEYLAEQRRALAEQGYYVRKLNTTYLAFFGSYSGSGNPYEVGLRRLRAEAPSLAAFLRQVSQIDEAADLPALIAEPAGTDPA